MKKLKEIQALNILSAHDNIIKLIEALYDEPSGIIYLTQENLLLFSSSWTWICTNVWKIKKILWPIKRLNSICFKYSELSNLCIAKEFFTETSNLKIF